MKQNGEHVREGERLLTICNSCRYCEGYCAVFPAMERRMQFSEADVHYLANLCHGCAECYYACQYAPPHEFAVNVPKVFAEIRARSYEKYAWPASIAKIFRGRGIVAIWAAVLAVLISGVANIGGAQFYNVIPHDSMVAIFLALGAYISFAQFAGLARFWRDTGEGFARFLQPAVLARTLSDILSLRNLDSGGAGCTYPNEMHSPARRRYHHFTFYGFMLCFAATTVAAIYDNVFGWVAPYNYTSVPVVLGTLGGIGLLIGPAGLLLLKRGRDSAIVDTKQDGVDVSLLALLFLTSFTGFMLLALRGTSSMGVLLVVHLAVVLALFVTMPYGKFVHGIYRAAALLKNALEQARQRQT